MAVRHITVAIKRAWWLTPYLYGVQLCSEITGLKPDCEKVAATALRGLKMVIK